jgi:transposase
MSTPLLPDALWNLIQPLLPPTPRRPKGGRPRLRDRAGLTGILFVLRSGIPWEMLPQELGCGSGMTWRLRALNSRLPDDIVRAVLGETSAL